MIMSMPCTDSLERLSSYPEISAAEDAARHKRLYDRRVGTVQLHPGDKVLVRLNAYRGQCRKIGKTDGEQICIQS